MAPKGKKSRKKDEKQELQEEAMAEWLARGMAIQDFTMEKMMAIWLEEDGGEDDEGNETLSAKQDMIKGLSVIAPLVEQAKEIAEVVKERVKEEAAHAIQTAWKYAEIPPLKRRRLLRQHVTHVLEMDRESRKYLTIRQRVNEEWESAQQEEKEIQFGLKKRNKSKAPLLQRFRQLKEEADSAQHARLRDEIEQRRRERMDAEITKKQQLRAEKEQFSENQRVYRRQMNAKYWKKQYTDAKEYAEQHSLSQERRNQFDEDMERMQAEIDEMNGQPATNAERDFARSVTTSSVGVFDTSFQPGEWNSAIDGGDQEGKDEYTAELFSTRVFQSENELLRIELMEAQSKTLSLREKIDQVEQVKANLLLDKKTILERKDRTLSEIKQVNAEHQELGRILAGPPRRDPTEDDKLQFHTLVTRRTEYMKQLQDLASRESNVEKRMQLATRSQQALQPLLEHAESREAELVARVGAIDHHQTDLPMVIGRSIQSDAGKLPIEANPETHMTEPQVNPAKLYTQVTMASKLELLKTAAVPVKEHYKRTKRLAIESWRTKEQNALDDYELEVTKTRLANVRDRLLGHQKDSVRADLMQAIIRFHKGPLKLRKCIFPIKGVFEWWQTQDRKRSTGLSFDEAENRVYLEPMTHSGQLQGCIRLPKHGMYTISLRVRVFRVNDRGALVPVNTDGASDEILEEDVEAQAPEILTFYLGGDFDGLQEHVFRDIGGKAIRIGPLTFEFYGSRFCFAFTFSHRMGRRPEESHYHLVLDNDARYDERIQDFREEESRMRLIQREKHFVSELVKTIRMQTKKTSSERNADLLEELILVEKSKAKTWDSAMLHGHQQRFKRLEYAKMLRSEIKKELAHQIDEDVRRRQGRAHQDYEPLIDESVHLDPLGENDETKEQRKDESRLDFLARKHALVEPQYIQAKQSLGQYCSFKASGGTDSYRKEALIMGIRLEWREGKTKLQVMHKLGSAPSTTTDKPTLNSEWCCLDDANAVFLESACTKALRRTRDEKAQERVLLKKREEQVEQMQRETQHTIQLEVEGAKREAREDAILQTQKDHELQRRGKLFHTDGIRTTTYNEQVASQMEFLAQRKANAMAQQRLVGNGENAHGPADATKDAFAQVLRQVKEEYAQNYATGRLALVKKTWERKEKRLADKRANERKEREFRIKQEHQLVLDIHTSNQQQIEALQAEHAKNAAQQLVIKDFNRAVHGQFECEHRELKAWGSKYDSGMKCKRCGKEMAKSFDEPDHTRGADPQLDRDVEVHRAQATGDNSVVLRLRHASHFDQIEQERLRLEKEARELELCEALLYDRLDPKAIDEFNYRHGMNRQPVDIGGADPLYLRTVQERHHAAFQDEILFHGRLNNFVFRINQLTELHQHTTTMIAVQRDFLENVQEENEFILSKLPLVESDHARAVRLVEEDMAALRALEAARKELALTKREREYAYFSMQGVEEEAEFAEFHAPNLIASSTEMTDIVDRMKNELLMIRQAMADAQNRVEIASKEREKTENMLARLGYRTRGAPVRTRFGFATILYYRQEDDRLVLSSRSWGATIFTPVEEVVAYETMLRNEETLLMEHEEEQTRRFLHQEEARRRSEWALMEQEEHDIHEIVAWRRRKEIEEATVTTAVCEEELRVQFEYETKQRKELFKVAAHEAKRLQQFPRLTRQRRMVAPSRPSKIDMMRVTRACEKRLAMAAVEQALLTRNASLRMEYVQDHNLIHVNTLGGNVFRGLVDTIVRDVCAETVSHERNASEEYAKVHNHAIVRRDGKPGEVLPIHIAVELDRAWLARKKKYELLHATWNKEFAKLQALRLEIARRDEIARRNEAERLLMETRRREMLAEERFCRKFYLEEMVLYMRERKAMAAAELEMREYMRQLELEAMKAKYAKMVEERNKTNDKAARRLEIKLGKNEKHRLHREWNQIKIEDELSFQVREEAIAKAQAEALERQFDKYLVQQSIDGKIAASLEASRIAERIKEAQLIAAEKKAAFDAQLVQERMMLTVETFHHLSRVELEWMNAVERVTYWTEKDKTLSANLKCMEVELKRILGEKEHVVADAKAKREHAEKCKQRASETDVALRLAIKKEAEMHKQYKKIHFLNATMDSEVLHGRVQQFRTLYLRDQLQTQYFYLLTESIIRRAIVECNEREAARLEEKLRKIEVERAFKIKEVGVLKRKRRRAFHMRLRRAELGKLMFGGSQRSLIKEKFQQWVTLWSQRVLVRASFEVKHGLLMQQHRLRDAQAKQVKDEVETKLTILHQHQKRRVQCRLCKQEYVEAQNNRSACSYHPGAYELACIRSCPTRHPGLATPAAISSDCMMHRARRWLCCDAIDEGRYGSNGCATRYHLPVRANPALAQLVDKKEKEENKLVAEFQRQLNEIQERNVFGRTTQATKDVINKMEKDLADKRAVAAKYFTLNYRR